VRLDGGGLELRGHAIPPCCECVQLLGAGLRDAALPGLRAAACGQLYGYLLLSMAAWPLCLAQRLPVRRCG
jgi:hypothetical protein